MTDLSPAARAVLDAVEDHGKFHYGRLAAAALRAADVAPRVESNLPAAYRLVRRGDGNGNKVPVLQGMFTWRQGPKSGIEWRDLETQDEPYVEDRVPFGSVFPLDYD